MTTRKALLEKFGSEEAISAYYKELGQKSHNTNGGFHALKKTDPKKLSEISRKAAQKRWQKSSK